MMACLHGFIMIVKALVKKGADVQLIKIVRFVQLQYRSSSYSSGFCILLSEVHVTAICISHDTFTIRFMILSLYDI